MLGFWGWWGKRKYSKRRRRGRRRSIRGKPYPFYHPRNHLYSPCGGWWSNRIRGRGKLVSIAFYNRCFWRIPRVRNRRRGRGNHRVVCGDEQT